MWQVVTVLSYLTFPVSIPDEERKSTDIFIFTLLFGTSKGFRAALKTFIRPFEAPKRSAKMKNLSLKTSSNNPGWQIGWALSLSELRNVLCNIVKAEWQILESTFFWYDWSGDEGVAIYFCENYYVKSNEEQIIILIFISFSQVSLTTSFQVTLIQKHKLQLRKSLLPGIAFITISSVFDFYFFLTLSGKIKSCT